MNKLLMLGLVVVLVGLGIVGSVEAQVLDTVTDTLGAASSITGNRFVALGVNIVLLGIIFAVLVFVLGKELKPNEQAIGVIAGIAIAALISFNLLQTQPGVYLWKIQQIANFLHVKVIVNSIAIALLLFIAKAIWADKYLTATVTKSAVSLLAIYLASMFAMQPFEGQNWDAVKDEYQYIWQTESGKGLLQFLFGDRGCEYEGTRGCYYKDESSTSGEPDGYGILMPPHLFSFILATLLLLWIFTSLIKGIGGEIKELKYIVAVLLGAFIANAGIGFTSVLFFAQIFAWIILFNEMRGAEGGNAWMAAGGATLIVGAISILAFPKQSILGRIITVFDILPGIDMSKPGQMFKALIYYIALPMVAIGIFIKFLVKKEKDARKKESGFFKDVFRKIGNGFRVAARHTLGQWGWLRTKKDLQNRRLTGTEPYIVKRSKVEQMTMFNWALRLEVFFGKWGAVAQGAKESADIHEAIDPEYDQGLINWYHTKYKRGTGKKIVHIAKDGKEYQLEDLKKMKKIPPMRKTEFRDKSPKTRVIHSSGKVGPEEDNEREQQCGGTDNFLVITHLLSKFMDETEGLTSDAGEIKDPTSVRTATLSALRLGERDRYYEGMLDTFYRQSVKVLENLYQFEMFDLYWMKGNYFHGFRYARDAATATVGEYDAAIESWSPSLKGSKGGFEVNEKNLEADSVNVANNDPKTENKVLARKVKPEWIVHQDFWLQMRDQEQAWRAFINQLRTGKYAVKSLTSEDYRAVLRQGEAYGKLNFNGLEATEALKTMQKPAFDRRALVNPGHISFPGLPRAGHYSNASKSGSGEGDSIRTPFPALSTKGLSNFLIYLYESWIPDAEKKAREMYTPTKSDAIGYTIFETGKGTFDNQDTIGTIGYRDQT